MKKLLLFLLSLPIYAQLISPSAAVRMGAVPSSCVAGSSNAIVVNNAGTDEILTCDNTGHYTLPPGGSTSVLTANGVGATGAAGANKLVGPANSIITTDGSGNGSVLPTVSGDGTLNAGTGALAVSKIAGVAPGTIFSLSATNTPLLGNPTIGGNKISGVRVASLPSSCVAGTDGAVTFASGSPLVDAQYTCDGTGHYSLPPGGSTTVLAGSGTFANGPGGSNNVLTTAAGTGAVQRQQNRRNNDTIHLPDFTGDPGIDFTPTNFSAPINNSASFITVNSGNTQVDCSAGCGFNTTAAVGNAFVVYTKNNSSIFQSTITFIDSNTRIHLASPVTFSSTGAFGYWGTDLTAQIDAAGAQALATGKCLYIPAISSGSIGSGGYFYNGAGLSGMRRPCIIGDGSHNSYIYLGVGKYFYDGNEFWYSSRFTDVGYIGGAGAIRDRFTGNNVVDGVFYFHGNYFRDYSASAITNNSSDIGNVHIEANTFAGQSSSTSMGVAFATMDEGVIKNNEFGNNVWNIKIGQGAQGVRILDNYCYTTCLWIVPSSATAITPTVFDGNRLGNEGLTSTMSRVLFADTAPSSGTTYFGDTLPLTTQSTGNITNFIFGEHNAVLGANTGGANPLVYSYTDNIYNSVFAGNLQNTLPGYVIQLDSVVPQSNKRTNINNVFGPFTGIQSNVGSNNLKISNYPGFGTSFDPSGQVGIVDPTIPTNWTTGTGQGGESDLLTVGVNSFSNVGGGTRVQITDAQGGTNAATYTASALGAISLSNSITAPTQGQTIWIDVELRNGSTGTSCTNVVPEILDNTGSVVIGQWNVTLSPVWRRTLIPYTLRNTLAGGATLGFINTNGAPQCSFDIEFVQTYQASQPKPGTKHYGEVETDSGAFCQDGSLTSGRCWYHGTGVPSLTTADGSFYTRDDTPWGIYQRQSGAWVKTVDCIATGCTVGGGGLTVSRGGSSDPFIILQSNGSTSLGQMRGLVSTPGFYWTNGAGSATWAALNGSAFGVGNNTNPSLDQFQVSVTTGAISTKPIATASLPTCTATTGTPWRASVNDATAPALGIALTGGGAIFANVHCSLTTGTYLVDGL